jgi:lipopolysaccharide export system permease protein
MIVHRAFYREATKTALALMVVLLVIFVFVSLTALLGRAAGGEFSGNILLTLLGLQTLRRLDQLLPLAVYLGALLTFSRWYRDSEMAALAACGVGLPQLLRPLFFFGLAAALIVSAFAMYLSPLALRVTEQVKEQNARRSGISLVAPGSFTETPGGERIMYAERANDAGELEFVFTSNLPTYRPGVAIAQTGTELTDPATGDKFLRLGNGTLYEGSAGKTDYRVAEFGSLLVRLAPKPLAEPSLSEAARPTLALLTAPPTLSVTAELHWRMARPLSVFVLTFFALVLSYTDIRRGRLSNLFVAILVYFIYSNLIGLANALLHKGKMPQALGIWWVHALMALLVIYFLRRRAAGRPLISLPGNGVDT